MIRRGGNAAQWLPRASEGFHIAVVTPPALHPRLAHHRERARAGADGIYASGSGTFVHIKNDSEISYNEGDGIYANLTRRCSWRQQGVNNSGDGVSAYKADVFLYDSVVENNASGYGANAVYLGDISFGWPAYSTPPQNNDLENNGSGTLRATSNSDLAAGTASGTNAQNNFIRDGSELHAYARTYSDVRAQGDWWGSASGPNLSFVDTDAGSTYTYDPFLTAPGGSCGITAAPPGTGCRDLEARRTRRWPRGDPAAGVGGGAGG